VRKIFVPSDSGRFLLEKAAFRCWRANKMFRIVLSLHHRLADLSSVNGFTAVSTDFMGGRDAVGEKRSWPLIGAGGHDSLRQPVPHQGEQYPGYVNFIGFDAVFGILQQVVLVSFDDCGEGEGGLRTQQIGYGRAVLLPEVERFWGEGLGTAVFIGWTQELHKVYLRVSQKSR